MQCMILIILWLSFSPSCLFYCYWLTFLFYSLDSYKIIDIIVPLSICMFSHICEMRFCTHYLLLLWQNACQIYIRTEGLIWAHGLKRYSLPSWEHLAPEASALRKERVSMTAAHFACGILFHPGSQPMVCCFLHLVWFFPTQLNLSRNILTNRPSGCASGDGESSQVHRDD